MEVKKVVFVIGIFVLFSLGLTLVSSSSVSVWQGQYYTGTTFNTGTYSFNFTVYDALIGGNACFTNTTSLTTGTWGQWKTEQSPWTNCNNASKEYFLNINIAGSDETPRRRLVVSDFLRGDVEVVKEGNLIVSDNVTADYYFGDGSSLTGVAGGGDINSVQGDNIYIYNGSDSGDVVLAFNESKLNGTIDDRVSSLGDNSSWNESHADGKYILQSEEGNLDVNSSVYSNSTIWWASVSSWLSGWFVNNGGDLEFNETKLNGTIDSKIDDIPDVGWLNDSFSTNTSLNVIVGGNITTSNYGFFGEVGSFLSRVTKLWVVDINASGNVSIGGDLQVGQNVSASWLNGLFNWFIEDNSSSFLSFNGSTLSFNESQLNSEIDSGIAASQVLYSPNSIETIVGMVDGGNLTSIESINEDDTYNVSETGANPGFVIVINFTDIEIFNQIYLEEYYDGKSGHTIRVQLYNFNSSTYDSFGSFSNQVDFNFQSLEVLSYQNYVNDSNVSLRLYHDDSGNPNHDIFVDYVALKYDSAGVVITDHGSLGGLEGDDHLQYLRTDGTRALEGNMNITGYGLVGFGLNVTNDSYFLSDLYVAGKLKGLSPVEIEGGVNVSGDSIFNDNINFTGTLYGNGSQLTDIEADTISDNSVTTNSIADNNITDAKIANLSWSKLVSAPAGLNDGDNNTIYYNSTGLDLNSSNYFSISTGYQMPQGCGDGEIAEYNTTSQEWDCAIDNSAASGMANWVLASSDTGGTESITDGETVTFSDDGKYLNATRSTKTIIYSVNEVELNATIDLRDSDTTYSHLTNFTDDLGDRGYDSLSNFTNDLSFITQSYGNGTYYRLSDFSIGDYFTSAQILGFDYYNSTDFDISNYYLNSNPFGYYNVTTLPSSTETDPYWTANFSLYNSSWSLDTDTTYSHLSNFTDDILWTASFNSTGDSRWSGGADTQKNASGFYVYNDSTTIYFNETKLNDTIDSRGNGGTYLNLSGENANQDINITPYNFETANLTLTQKLTFDFGDVIDNIVNTWIRFSGGINVTKGAIIGWDLNVSGNITAEEIHFENNPVNHRIYDNSTCVIIRGDTSAMYIC